VRIDLSPENKERRTKNAEADARADYGIVTIAMPALLPLPLTRVEKGLRLPQYTNTTKKSL
jgi:hypothetical protein